MKLFYFKYIIVLIIMSMCFLSETYTQVLITEESFDDESNGDITGVMTNGEPWEANTFGFCGPDNPGVWGVENGSFVCNNVEGFDCCGCGPFGLGPAECGDNKNEINFGPIDISSFQGLLFNFNINIVGDLECSSIGGNNCPSGSPYNGCIGGGNDQMLLSYSIDGGAYETAIYYCGEELCIDDAPLQCGLDAQSLIVRVRMGTQQFQEFYYIESLSVLGYPKTSANAIATPASICEGGDIQLSENGGDAVSWLWSGPDGFTSTIQNPILSNVSANNQGTYTVMITDNNGCTDESSVDISTIDAPTASLTSTFDFCQGDCYQISTNMSQGAEPYEAFFTLEIGSFNVPFSITSYDINNELNICYSGTLAPYYDNSNTLFIPVSLSGVPFTGNGTLTMTALIDDNNCEAQIIDPNNITLNFKEKLEISSAEPLEECDDNNDGFASFDLSELNSTLISGSSTVSINWFEDSDCTILIIDPTSYQTETKTVYVFLSGNNKCNSDTIPIDLLVFDIPIPGEDNYDVFCGAPQALIDIESYLGVNYDINGKWTNSNGFDISDINNVDMSGEADGIYLFHYEVHNPPCNPQISTITIEIIAAPNAGQNNELYVCNLGINTVLNLEGALGSHDTIGEWKDLDDSGIDLTVPTSVDFNGVAIDTFHYSYILLENGICKSDSATITVIIETSPFAGIDGGDNICIGSTDTLNLFDYLGQNIDSTGIWSQIGGHSIDINRPDTMVFTSQPVGIDTFLYVKSGFCGFDSAFVFINITDSPNAGTNNNYTVCNSNQNNFVNLDSLLGIHDNSGSWINLNNINVDLVNINKVNFYKVNEGAYQFKYLINANETCPADSAIITIDVVNKLSAGQDSHLTFCQDGSALVSILDELKPDISPQYFIEDLNQSGALNDQTLMVDISLLDNGTYSYRLITGQDELCGMDTSFLTITIVEAYKAGENNNLEVCNGNMEFDMDILLGEHDSGGIWIDLDNSNVDVETSAAKQVSFKGIEKGIYRYEYKIEASGTCPETSAIITVEVNPVTYSNYSQQVCPGQTITIGNTDYSLNNPNGEEVLSNVYGCDSIVSVNLTPKLISSSFTIKNENCFSLGKFVLKSMNNAVLPVTLSILNVGNYDISNFPFVIDNLVGGNYSFDITDKDGCISDANTTFSIESFTPFDIDINVVTNENDYSLSVSTNININSITWSPGNWLSCDDCLNPIAKPEFDQEYIVTIIDEEGCTVSDTIFLNAFEVEEDIIIDIPNVFTPNDDGNNDIFYAKSNIDNYKYSLAVYNRWGEKVFYGDELFFNNSNYGWNGLYKDKKLNPGVYVYILTVKIPNQEKQVHAGDVLLLK